jgi:hypothetical protein
VNATGTQITGLFVPGGSGTNLPITLDTNNLGPQTLTQTFSYQFSLTGGIGGGGGSNNRTDCAANGEGGVAWVLGLLGLLATAVTLRRKRA